MEGIIYLLSNPVMPGIIKIGRTYKEDVKVRMKELYSSGVPLPFDCEYAATVRNIDLVEKALHTAFSPNRLNPKREFFEIEANQAIAIIKLLEIQNVSPLVEQEANVIDKAELEAGKAYAQKRPRLNFVEMGIPIGSELFFNNNAEIAIVVSERSVQFRGEETSITNATRMALGDGYAYHVAPGPYWTFQGRKLRDIYNDTYQRPE
ncbi:MAG: GIY-YIG nuclease family protein [Bacteroidetes bacterium]|nr:GIY-YIG nuclease family protein [Bacteroidota bacterium]